MDLSVELIEQSGAFVKDALVKKQITFTDKNTGKKVSADVYVKRLSYHAVVNEINNQADFIAARIAASIYNKSGKPIFTVDQILGNDERGPLSADITSELLNAIGEVNALGKQEPQ